jgi:beta-lactam-binding protein with PASTA domain
MSGRSGRYLRMLPQRRDTPERRYFKITTLLVVVVVLIMIIGSVVTFFLSIKGPEPVMVPEVAGPPDNTHELVPAMEKLQERGLYAMIQVKHSSLYPQGTVIAQRPRAGAIVKAGRRILLTVSAGAVTNKVGDYVGKTLNAVRIELRTFFASDTQPLIQIEEPVMYVYDESPPETILEQNPRAGTAVYEGTVTYVSLVASQGPKGEHFIVESYIGRAIAETVDELAQASSPFVFDVRPAERGERAGIIVEQSPEAGEEVPKRSPLFFTATEPSGLEEGQRFGVYQVELPLYPILVDIELRERLVTEERILMSMKHPGGKIAIPYVVAENADVAFFINGNEKR